MRQVPGVSRVSLEPKEMKEQEDSQGLQVLLVCRYRHYFFPLKTYCIYCISLLDPQGSCMHVSEAVLSFV